MGRLRGRRQVASALTIVYQLRRFPKAKTAAASGVSCERNDDVGRMNAELKNDGDRDDDDDDDWDGA